MVTTELRSPGVPYGGYYHREVPDDDRELTRVGPGTPCGEYLRRFWHPVGLSSELKDFPRAITMLGEDLVLFRDGRGRVGLLERHCSHRGTSLEFGTVEREGIRCCYHGWAYGVDGKVLDTPGEPPDSMFKDRLYHRAYPTLEYKGMVFAYMGPPEKRPEFPIYDAFDMPGYRAVPQERRHQSDIQACNWLQLAENNMDPVHRIFLHGLEDGRAKLDQYRPGADPGGSRGGYVDAGLKQWEAHVAGQRDDMQRHVIEYQETPSGMMYIDTRRMGELVWVRMADYILPNVDQIPRPILVEEESQEMPFDPPRTTTWTVPVDDTHTIGFSFVYTPVGLDGFPPQRWRFASPRDSVGRTYEQRQSQPGDYEAQGSQRPIAVHALEHLGWSDTGVITLRKLLREGIRAVQRGEDPKQIDLAREGVIGTCARSKIVRVPPAASLEADRALLRETGRKVFAERPTFLVTPA